MRTALKILTLLVLKLLSLYTSAQEYNYIHYTNKDGLAGNTVYGVAQDKDGYMFFATENGLSRFDGKEWETFTVKDGLPDNEVLSIYCDKNNRLWIFTFNNKTCYLRDGIFHTEYNDSLVSKIKFKQPFQNAMESQLCDDKLHLTGTHNVYVIRGNQIFQSWESDSNNKQLFRVIFDSINCKTFISIEDSTFELENNKLTYSCLDKYYSFRKQNKTSNRNLPNYFAIKDLDKYLKLLSLYYDLPEDVYVETNEGCIFFDKSKSFIKVYLPNKKVGHHFLDLEGNHWFTTMGEGVFKLGSTAFYTYGVIDKTNKQNKEIFTVTKSCDKIFSGASYGKLGIMSKNKILTFENYQSFNKFSSSTDNINRLVSLLSTNSSLILGFDNLLGKIQNNQFAYNSKVRPNKSIEKIDSNLVIATGKGVFKISIQNLQITDTIFSQRSTYANYLNHQYYIGTTNGLFIVDELKQQTYIGDIHPVLRRRITSIKNYNNKVYVATADAGIVILTNNRIVGLITDSTGLSSSNIKTLHISGSILWVGTIKGINKIDLNTNKVLSKYTTNDGLPSDIINAIYYDNSDSSIWVGSPEGLTFFKEKDILSQSMCNLVIENISISKTSIKTDSNQFSLKYYDNIQFQFVGISLRSGDEIVYHYKLDGLDVNYNTTTERLLSYPSLPPGNYTLTLYATNKFGVKSKTYTCSFYVNPPFWKTWWFYTLELSAFAFIIWLILYTRFKRKKKEYKLNADFKVLLADMEQQALQAQMNPHFIFNSLNSIQQFMLQNDKQQANKYLTSFASLIRKTLNYSAQKNISVTDEVEYLKQYVGLELLRFNNSFTCIINVSDDIESDLITIPALLLQPFVENAIRHGIRNKTTSDGVLLIEFSMQNDNLICVIEDNGVGRKKAQEIKSQTHFEYQSKGLDITEKRITLLNTKPNSKLRLDVIDLVEGGNATGTRVIVSITV